MANLIWLVPLLVVSLLALNDESTQARKYKASSTRSVNRVYNKLANNIYEQMDHDANPCDDFHQYACGGVLKDPVSRIGMIDEWHELDPMPFDSFHTTGDESSPIEIPGQGGIWAKIRDLSRTFNRSCIEREPVPATMDDRLAFPRKIVAQVMRGRTLKDNDWIDMQIGVANYWETLKMTQVKPGTRLDIPKNRNVFFSLSTRPGKKMEPIVVIGLRDTDFSLPKEIKNLNPKEDFYNVLTTLSEKLADLRQRIDDLQESKNDDGELMTVEKLQTRVPDIDWPRLIAGFYGRTELDQGQRIELRQAEGVKLMAKFLIKYNSSPAGAYALSAWTVYKTAIENIAPRFVEENCNLLSKVYFAPAFVARHKRLLEDKRDKILLMSKAIVRAYGEVIENSRWPTDEMKTIALDKLNKMNINIGYSDFALDSKILNRLYGGLRLDPADFAKNKEEIEKIFEHSGDREAEDLRVEFWQYNAFYNADSNSVNPLTKFIDKLYHNDWPSYANFGRLGVIIAHEISHAYDRIGTKYNSHGEEVHDTMWGVEGHKKHEEQIKCLIPLYENRQVPGTIRRQNGSRTINENMADSEMFVVTYKAYLKQRGELIRSEPLLPGLNNLTRRQMFWLNAAQYWCRRPSNYDNEHLIWNHISNYKLRVNIPIMMQPEFRKDFGCPLDVNTNQRCRLW